MRASDYVIWALGLACIGVSVAIVVVVLNKKPQPAVANVPAVPAVVPVAQVEPEPEPEPTPQVEPQPRQQPRSDGSRGVGLQIVQHVANNGGLTNPSRAQWIWSTVQTSNQTVIDGGESFHLYAVSGMVDCENAFGAMVRHRWEVLMAKEGDEYFPLKVFIAGRQVYGSK